MDAALWRPAPERIAVFRALQLGDMLCAVPALRALRTQAPRARITLIGLPWAESFARRFARYVDDTLVFPGAPGFPEQPPRPEALDAFFEAARRRRFDLALQLHGSGTLSNGIVAQLGASRCAGFAPQRQDRPGFPVWPRRGAEPRRWLGLLQRLGVAARGTRLELPVTAAERRAARALQARHGLAPRRYLVLHPGARLPSRRWPLERFTQVGRALAADGWRIAVTGAADEAPLVEGLAFLIGAQAVSLAGATGLGELAALIGDSRLLVANDTGVSHVAAALRTPSVIVACGSDAARWAPLNRRRHRVLAHALPCRPCAHVECPVGHGCAHAIEPAAVLAECRSLLEDLRHAA